MLVTTAGNKRVKKGDFQKIRDFFPSEIAKFIGTKTLTLGLSLSVYNYIRSD